jgi:hypothetical protein
VYALLRLPLPLSPVSLGDAVDAGEAENSSGNKRYTGDGRGEATYDERARQVASEVLIASIIVIPP